MEGKTDLSVWFVLNNGMYYIIFKNCFRKSNNLVQGAPEVRPTRNAPQSIGIFPGVQNKRL